MKKNENGAYNGVREIARRANVSIATVDRVIHKRGGVALETLEKINQIIKELNFQPNLLASRLASKRIFHFATLIPQTSKETDYWEAPLKGIIRAEEELKQFGVSINKFFYDLNDKKTFIKQANSILKHNLDGILLAPSFIDESRKFLQKCDETKIPYVFINSDLTDINSVSYIGSNLFQSGYLGARLIQYGLKEKNTILVVNISRDIDYYHHLKRKENGFRAFFEEKKLNYKIISIEITETSTASVEKGIKKALEENPDIKAIFVTNSRVSVVARLLEKEKPASRKILVGFDFLKENIKYLQKEIIDFLICHKPEEASYRAIFTLYQNRFKENNIEKIQYMPIDIITKENAMFYSN